MSSGTIITDYLGRGLFAARPVTPPVPASGTAFYYSTDTLALYVWDGSAWQLVPQGTVTALLDSLGSTQGDILYRNATVWTILAPGTSGQFLKTLGAAANPAWGTPAGGPSFQPGYASGQYYTSALINSLTTFVMAQNILYAMPFYVPVATTFTKASVRVSATDAGKLVEIGIYANAAGIPTTLEFDCGNVSTTTGGQIELTGLTLALAANWHWLVVATNSNGVASIFSTGSTDALTGSLLGFNAVNTVTTGITGAWTFSAGALPTPFPAVTYITNQKMPLAFLRL